MTILFKNKTDNGTSDIKDHRGGSLQIAVVGDLDGASIQPQINQDELGFIDFGDPITTQIAFFIQSKQADFQFVMTDTGTGGGSGTDISLSAL